MKLTLKLVFALTALIVVIMGVEAYLSVRRESQFLTKVLEQKAYRIGNAMKELVADAWRRQGPDMAISLVRAANQSEELVMIRWVWLDTSADERFVPQVPSEKLDQNIDREAYTINYHASDGTSMLVTYVNINVGKRRGALELSEPLSTIDEFVRTSIRRKLVLMAAVVAGVAGTTLFLGIWLVGWPLQSLTDKAHRVGTGDLSGPVELRGRDELSVLAGTFNQMCDRLQESLGRERQEAQARIAAIEQLRHADRLRTVGQLASGVAHELGTPLNVVTGRASMISSGRLSADEIADNAEIIKTQADRMATIIRKLLDFSRSGTARRSQVDLRIIVTETTRILEQLSEKKGVRLVAVECPEPMMADVDAGQIQQVLTNLVVNGIQATPSGGRVTIRLTKVERPPNPESVSLVPDADYFCLEVEDTGEGIPKEVRGRLFEPFVTTKEIGQGTGLGLSIAYGIVSEHHGWIDVQSEPGFGSRFRVYLPSRIHS